MPVECYPRAGMAERTEGSIEIAAPPREVMRVIADFDAYPSWAQGVREVQVLETGPDGRAVRVSMHVSSGMIDTRYTLVYEYGPDDAGLSWTTQEASGAVRSLEGEYALEPKDDTTLVTYRLSTEPAISLPGFLRRTIERTIVDTALGGLKKRVESGQD
jgi:ribosome-associated toxin RatA of RatAB toxin-antitoxin module